MVALGTAALAALLTVAILVGPGLIAARLAFAEEGSAHDDARPLLLAFAWGAGAVPTLAFFLHLATGLFVSVATMAGVALAHYVAAAVISHRRRGRGEDAGFDWWIDPLRGVTPAVWATLLSVGAFWLVRYDPAPLPPESSCIYGAALVATGHREEGASLLFENLEDARLGNSGVIAGFVALYGTLGFRLLFAACGALMALGGRALGAAAAPGSWWAPVLGAAVLALNPWVLSLPQADENVLALAFGAPALGLMLGRRPPWLMVGTLLGLMLAMRHVLILSVPAVLLWAWWAPQRRRAVGRLVLGLALATAFEHLHHHLALGSVLRFESNPQFAALPYSLVGMSFTWEGMVNWPLHDTLVRTPWNPFPMWLAWPLHGLKAWGSAATALVAVGVVFGLVKDRRAAMFWGVWVVPSALLLGMQESWDFPNKMGVALVLFAALPWAAVRGIDALDKRGWAAIAFVLALGGLLATTQALDGPVGVADARYHERFPFAPEEEAYTVRFAAIEAADVGLLPSMSLLTRHGELLDTDHLAHLWQTLSDPAIKEESHPWNWGPSETEEPRGTVTLAIRPTKLHAPEFAITDGEPHIDLTVVGAGSAGGLVVPGDERTLHAYGVRGPRASAITLGLPYPGEPDALCACSLIEEEFHGPCEDRCSVLFDVAGVLVRGPEPGAPAPWPVPGVVGGEAWPEPAEADPFELRVRLPAGAVSFGFVQLPYANRLQLWRLKVTREGVTVLDGPLWPWHG